MGYLILIKMRKNKLHKLQTIIIENDGDLLTASQIYIKLRMKWKSVEYKSPNSLAHSGLKIIKLNIIHNSPTSVKKYIYDKLKCPIWNDYGISYRRYLKL